MSTPYTPTYTVHSTIDLPSDGELRNSTIFARFLQQLADNAFVGITAGARWLALTKTLTITDSATLSSNGIVFVDTTGIAANGKTITLRDSAYVTTGAVYIVSTGAYAVKVIDPRGGSYFYNVPPYSVSVFGFDPTDTTNSANGSWYPWLALPKRGSVRQVALTPGISQAIVAGEGDLIEAGFATTDTGTAIVFSPVTQRMFEGQCFSIFNNGTGAFLVGTTRSDGSTRNSTHYSLAAGQWIRIQIMPDTGGTNELMMVSLATTGTVVP